jgi:hypothetical protein
MEKDKKTNGRADKWTNEQMGERTNNITISTNIRLQSVNVIKLFFLHHSMLKKAKLSLSGSSRKFDMWEEGQDWT